MPGAAFDDTAQALARIESWADLPQQELRALKEMCTALRVGEGCVLTVERGQGRECFIIADGVATVSVGDRLVGRVGSGECVGEVALLDGGDRSATVTAETDMTVLVLSRQEFNSILESSPSLRRKIAAGMATRLRHAEVRAFAAG